MSSSDTPKTREQLIAVCSHGSIRYKCEICDLHEEVDRLNRELAAMTADRDAQKAGWDNASLVCLRLERERNEARNALCDALDYYHNMWGDEAGTSWRHQKNERAARWRKSAGLEKSK